mmetsp:Transcript_13637/g.33368  ORF Transcript_13637/g.33368 Transcript_13637/m.33368 type:complete len:109 (+) Transcript_13637:121-447(+)
MFLLPYFVIHARMINDKLNPVKGMKWLELNCNIMLLSEAILENIALTSLVHRFANAQALSKHSASLRNSSPGNSKLPCPEIYHLANSISLFVVEEDTVCCINLEEGAI